MTVSNIVNIILALAFAGALFLLFLWKKNAEYYRHLSERWEHNFQVSNDANKKLMSDNMALLGEKELLSMEYKQKESEYEQCRKDRDRYYSMAHNIDRSRLQQLERRSD